MARRTAADAQAPVPTDGDEYKVVFENDGVRVLDDRDRAGERTNPHRHLAFVPMARSDFKRTLTLPDGKALQRQFEEGDVVGSDAQTHIGGNTGDMPTHVVVVELKPVEAACRGLRERSCARQSRR